MRSGRARTTACRTHASPQAAAYRWKAHVRLLIARPEWSRWGLPSWAVERELNGDTERHQRVVGEADLSYISIESAAVSPNAGELQPVQDARGQLAISGQPGPGSPEDRPSFVPIDDL